MSCRNILPIIGYRSVNAMTVGNNRVFAGTTSGLFVSTDNGRNWDAASSTLSSEYDIQSVAICDKVILAGITYNGIFRSTDDGNTWTNVCPSLKHCVAIAAGEKMVAGDNRMGVYISSDSGNTWNPANSGLQDSAIMSLAIHDNFIFAGTGSGIFMSSDYGTNWVFLDSTKKITHICALLAEDSMFIAGTGFGDIYLSTDNGKNWVCSYTGPDGSMVCNLLRSGDTIFAGTRYAGVLVSTDNGKHWSYKNDGILQTDIASIIVVDTVIFAATAGAGILLTTNNGEYWKPVNTGLPSYRVYALAFHGSAMFAGTSSGVCRSMNNGSTWESFENELSNQYVTSIITAGNDLFAGKGSGAVYVSKDSARNWSAVKNGLPSTTSIMCLLLSDSTLFAGTNDRGVFRSSNYGLTWDSSNVGLARRDVRCLTEYQHTLFAGTSGGIFISTNNDGSWSSINIGSTISCFASTDEFLFAGSYYGQFYRSADHGVTWKESRDKFPNPIKALAVKGKTLFAGGAINGIWRRPISEFTKIEFPQQHLLKPEAVFVTYGRYGRSQFVKAELMIPGPERVSIEIFNTVGKRVAIPVNDFRAAGTHSFILETSLLTPGYYMVRLQTEHSAFVKNIVALH